MCRVDGGMSEPSPSLNLSRVQVRAARPDEHARCERELAAHHYLPSAQVAGHRGWQIAECDGEWVAVMLWCAAAKRLKPREAWIGLPTLKAIVGQMVVPAWLDRMLARKAWEGQMTDEPETARADNLVEPVVGKHALSGRFGDGAKPRVRAFDAGLVRAAIGGVGLLLVAALVAWGIAD